MGHIIAHMTLLTGKLVSRWRRDATVEQGLRPRFTVSGVLEGSHRGAVRDIGRIDQAAEVLVAHAVE